MLDKKSSSAILIFSFAFFFSQSCLLFAKRSCMALYLLLLYMNLSRLCEFFYYFLNTSISQGSALWHLHIYHDDGVVMYVVRYGGYFLPFPRPQHSPTFVDWPRQGRRDGETGWVFVAQYRYYLVTQVSRNLLTYLQINNTNLRRRLTWTAVTKEHRNNIA